MTALEKDIIKRYHELATVHGFGCGGTYNALREEYGLSIDTLMRIVSHRREKEIKMQGSPLMGEIMMEIADHILPAEHEPPFQNHYNLVWEAVEKWHNEHLNEHTQRTGLPDQGKTS